MATALMNVEGDYFRLTEEVLAEGIAASRASERRRMILPIHRKQGASVQRMLNFFQPGTYVRPHLHPLDGAIETIMVIRGALGFVLFDEAGEIMEKTVLREGGLGLLDIEPGVWHGMVALEEDTVILEIKQGPYNIETDKVFAKWAPEEGEAGYEEIVKTVEEAVAGV